MRRYARDPYWLSARYPGTCARCGAPIARGARSFYYPSNRSLYCAANGCGADASADFESMAMDEWMAGGAR